MTEKNFLKRSNCDEKDQSTFPQGGKFTKLCSSTANEKDIAGSSQLSQLQGNTEQQNTSVDSIRQHTRVNCQMSPFQGNIEHQNTFYSMTSIPQHTQSNDPLSHRSGTHSTQHQQCSSFITRTNNLPAQSGYQHQSSSFLDSVTLSRQHPKLVSSLNINQTCVPVCVKKEEKNTQSGAGSFGQNTIRANQSCQCSVSVDSMSQITQHHTSVSASNIDQTCSLPVYVKTEHENTESSAGSYEQKATRFWTPTNNANQTCVPVCVKKEEENMQSSAGSFGQSIIKVNQSGPEKERSTDIMSTAQSNGEETFLDNVGNSKSAHELGWLNMNAINVYLGINNRNSTLPIPFPLIKTEKHENTISSYSSRTNMTSALPLSVPPRKETSDFCSQHENSKLLSQNHGNLLHIKQERVDPIYTQVSVFNQRGKSQMANDLLKKKQVQPVCSQTSQAGTNSHFDMSNSAQAPETRTLRETCMSLQRGIFQFVPCSVPLSIADAYLMVEKQQCEELGELPTPRLAVYAYNPLEYAFDVHFKFVQRFCNTEKEILFLGMNPGPWGMSQNGVPFGEVRVVRDWMQLSGNVLTPDPENPKRPITGLECTRSEVSGSRFWGLFQGLCGTPENFFKSCFVYNMCPLSFMSATGKNITPPKIEAKLRNEMNSICDRALLKVVELLKVRTIVAVGKYAHDRAQEMLKRAGDHSVRLETMMHPSPINPAANQGWEQKVKGQLLAFNLLDIIQV